LIEACRQKKRPAQKELYQRFAYTMKGICLRYAHSEEEAEDLLQEGFIRVFKHLDNYTDTGSLGGWIRTIMVNTAIENYRKQKTKEKHYAAFELLNKDESTNEILASIDLDYLMEKVQQLSSGYRMVFNLYAIEGFNHREIAEQLSISVGTSKSQYARAKKMLREMIEKDNQLEQKMMKNAR